MFNLFKNKEVPFCKDCKFYIEGIWGNSEHARCSRKKLEQMNLVSGEINKWTEFLSCQLERQGFGNMWSKRKIF